MMKTRPKAEVRREIVARALCRFEGNPENIMFEGNPMWMSYLDQADAVLKALDEEETKGSA